MSATARLTVAGAVATALSALSLGTVLAGGWMWEVGLAIVVVVGAGALARRVGLPAVLVPVTSAAALVAYLTVTFVRDQAWLWWVPTPGAARAFADLLAAGGDAIAQSSPPAVATPGLLVLTVIGVGATAIAVDTLAVTYRRAALAGLPLLVLYIVPSSLSATGVGWLTFVLGGAGYLGLLLVDSQERLTRWGRGTGAARGSTGEVATGSLLPVAQRVGTAALALSIVVPLVLPSLDHALLPWSTGTGPGLGGGSTSVVVDNPILDLRDDLVRPANREVLRYTTDAPKPSYLRVVTLDEFDGEKWSPSKLEVPNSQDVSKGLPSPPGLDPAAPTATVTTTVDIGALDQRWLPLPYPPSRVEIDGLWLYDLATYNVFSTRDKTLGLHYVVSSLDVAVSPDRLRAASTPPSALEPYLQLPGDLPTSVGAIAAEVTAGATTSYDQALALQNWLRDPQRFRYDTSAPDGTGSSAIEAFLTRRSGFCVHFASTMAVMARALGIPARVDVGFTPGRTAKDGSRVVTLHDAHAWPELYFDGVGWVAFEPTPAVRTGEPPAYAQSVSDTPDVATAPTASSSASTGVNPRVNDPDLRREGLDDPLAGGAEAPNAGWPIPWPVAVSLVLLLLVAATPRLVRATVRRRRLARRPDEAAWARDVWRELADSVRDLDYGWPPSQTPRQAAAHLRETGRLRGEASDALTRLGASAERARYAPTVGAVGDLVADFRTVVGSLARRRSRTVRFWAWLLPPTVLARLTGRRAAAIDATATLDGAGASRPKVSV